MSTAPHETPPFSAHSLLDRPRADRVREFRYRFAQSAVFGAPVIALQFLGPALGGASAFLWIGLLQAILAGWILYIAATGLLIEGAAVLLMRRRFTADLVVAGFSTLLYLAGLFAYIRTLLNLHHRLDFYFFLSTGLLIVWSLLRWSMLSRRRDDASPSSSTGPRPS